MTHGKHICEQLKAVRKGVAEENGIPLDIEECTFKGECRGTCPRCEAEVRYLENALTERMKLGKVATIAGLALGLAATTTQAQTPVKTNKEVDTISRRCENLQYPSLSAENKNKMPEIESLAPLDIIELVKPPQMVTKTIIMGGIGDEYENPEMPEMIMYNNSPPGHEFYFQGSNNTVIVIR